MIPVVSPVSQQASLVIDTPAEVSAWLNGKPVVISGESREKGEPRTALVDLPKGSSTLLIRLTCDGAANDRAWLVTTFVADQPVGFDAGGPALEPTRGLRRVPAGIAGDRAAGPTG